MSRAVQLAAELGLTIERDGSPLQRGISGIGRQRLLATVHPTRKIITLFLLNLTDHAANSNREVADLEEEMIRHEVYHFLSWQEKTQNGQKWNPRCPAEEAAAEAFAQGGVKRPTF